MADFGAAALDQATNTPPARKGTRSVLRIDQAGQRALKRGSPVRAKLGDKLGLLDGQHREQRHTPDQIIRKLAEGNKLLGAGQELAEVCRHLEIAESTWHRWVAQYGGMKANDAKRLKELEGENTRLKRLLANAMLENEVIKEALQKKW